MVTPVLNSDTSSDTSSPLLVRGPVPIEDRPDRVVVGPGAGVTFDGTRYRLSLVVTVVADGSRRCERFDRTALSSIRSTVARAIADGASIVWLRDRDWLLEYLGGFVVRLETALSAIAAEYGVPFVAWTGGRSERGSPDGTPAFDGVYDAVVDRARPQ